ncbi:hypothetical protein E8E13_003011 [Curvularia kusanoi]|uniref:Uncharacterized protein n=1 Tax=Curvularia kusanoi TaxID=90978 RepID=A0A9P4T7V0_CURKU|nr:hypothetical protein E8E13_003011 [Curvularia kusanoi]
MSNTKDHPSPPSSLYGHEEAPADDSTQPSGSSSSNIPIARTPRPFRTYEVNSTPYRSEVTSSPRGPNNISDAGYGSVTTVIHIGNGQIPEQQSQVTNTSSGQGAGNNEGPSSSGPAGSSESASVQDDQIQREAESENRQDDRWAGFHEVDFEGFDSRSNRQPTTSIDSQNNVGRSSHSLDFDNDTNMGPFPGALTTELRIESSVKPTVKSIAESTVEHAVEPTIVHNSS